LITTNLSPEKIQISTHKIDPSFVPKNIRKVIVTLKKNGHEAYLVGGCIRDQLLQVKPKDFDIATSASPEKIKKLIPRSRIIGRRFKLVHVRSGRNFIEVATFRSEKPNKSQTKEGMILDDNHYGNAYEDAFRRDFTMNSLFYDIDTQEIIDFTGGYKDIRNKKIRVLGNIDNRFKEDPVRMLRAVRFSSKLNLKLEKSIEKKISNLGFLILNVPPARRLDEINKLFLFGNSYKNYLYLEDLNIFKYLFPSLKTNIKSNNDYFKNFIEISLKGTDKRVQENKTVILPFLIATLLWPGLVKSFGEINTYQVKYTELRLHAIYLLEEQSNFCFIPKNMKDAIFQIWALQIKLMKTNSQSAHRLIEQKKFRAGFDFLINRELAGLNLDDIGHWWESFQFSSFKKRKKMIERSKKFGTKIHTNNKFLH
tara:strand:+ start:11316 stop:12587 length:1272 start_codon:yes stop_codon:yes gene_type:complete